ncbi:MAG TPA: hypothetical protein VFA52_02080 [Candidatus Paceibacterota bacterium]|nr:hypothetical protein [Candidatus Paceibacterota bacterium]
MDKVPSRIPYQSGQEPKPCGHFLPDCQLVEITDRYGGRNRIYHCIDPLCGASEEVAEKTGLEIGTYKCPASLEPHTGKAHRLSKDERERFRAALLQGVPEEKLRAEYKLEIQPEKSDD